jgi:hypothetical protein
MWRIGRAPNSIPIYSYIQQDATLHILFISGNYSTCFGSYFHPSSGAHTPVSTASGICHTVTVICRYRGRVGTGLSGLWVAYATHSTLKPAALWPHYGLTKAALWLHYGRTMAALWPWGWLSLYQKWVPRIFPGGKGARCVRLTTLPSSCAECLEIWEPQPTGNLRACPGL